MLEKHARLLLDLPPEGNEDWGQVRECNEEGSYLYPDYSGRCMYGKTTCGIVVPSGTSVATLLGEALERLKDDMIDTTIAGFQRTGEYDDDAQRMSDLFSDLVRASRDWKTDSMGRDSIIVY